jgi:hypothetical protein
MILSWLLSFDSMLRLYSSIDWSGVIEVAFVVMRVGACLLCTGVASWDFFSPLNGGAGGSKSEAKENLSASTSDQ